MLLWLMAASGCVWEWGGECRLGTWPESPLFTTYHAKVLLIRLIKCFVGTGPTLHATNTSSSATPTPPLHPFIFHIFAWELLSSCIITSETLATSSLAVCQRLFLPVKFWDITYQCCFLFPLDNQRTFNCFYPLHSKKNLALWHPKSFSNMSQQFNEFICMHNGQWLYDTTFTRFQNGCFALQNKHPEYLKAVIRKILISFPDEAQMFIGSRRLSCESHIGLWKKKRKKEVHLVR